MKTGLTVAVLVVLFAGCGDTVETTTTPAVTTEAATTTATSATTTPAAATTAAPATTAVPATTIAPTTTTTTTIDPNAPVFVELSFAAGEVVGPDRVEVDKGDIVSLVVTSDVAEEVHIHGYDVFADVEPGGTVTLEFEASIQGIFEVELENSRTELLELVVS